MELTDKQFHDFNAWYMEKYVDEVHAHGNGGFRTVTNRRTATRYALAKLLEGLEPVTDTEPVEEPVPVSLAGISPGDRVELIVDLKPQFFDLPKGSKATVIRIDVTDIVVVFDDDDRKTHRWMEPHELRKL